MAAVDSNVKKSEHIKFVERSYNDHRADVTNAVMGLRHSPDGKYIAAALNGGTMLWLTGTGKVISGNIMPVVGDESDALTCVRFSPIPGEAPDHPYRAVTTSTSGNVQLMDIVASQQTDRFSVKSTPLQAVREEGNQVMTADFSPDGQSIVTAGTDGSVRTYSAALEPQITFSEGIDRHGQPTLGHKNRIFSVRWASPHTFISAAWECSPLLYDTRVGQKAQRLFAGPRVSGDAIDVVGNTVVVGSVRSSEQLQWYDLSTGRERSKLPDLGMEVYSVRLVGRESRLHAWVAGHNEPGVACVDLHNGKIVHEARGMAEPLFVVDPNPVRNNHVFAAGGHNALYRVEMDKAED